MDKFFDNFYNYAGFGPAIETREVPASSLKKYKNKLPDQLLSYWRSYGWSGYANGLFWLADPEEWHGVLEAWIGDTPLMEKDAYHVIARGAFGELYLWGERTGASISVRSAWGMIFPSFNEIQFLEYGPDFAMQLFFCSQIRKSMDLQDVDEKPLFERALKKLGRLTHNTMYGFSPALSVTGEPRLENLKTVDALVHLEILAQLTPREIMLDINKMVRDN